MKKLLLCNNTETIKFIKYTIDVVRFLIHGVLMTSKIKAAKNTNNGLKNYYVDIGYLNLHKIGVILTENMNSYRNERQSIAILC